MLLRQGCHKLARTVSDFLEQRQQQGAFRSEPLHQHGRRDAIEYLDGDNVLFPNSLILALSSGVRFRSSRGPGARDGLSTSGVLEIPLPRPQVLEPTTAATVTSDAHTWLAPLRFEITRYSRPASASRAITKTGQNRRTMTSAVIRAAREMDDPACTQAAMLGCTATSGSAMSTDRQTQP